MAWFKPHWTSTSSVEKFISAWGLDNFNLMNQEGVEDLERVENTDYSCRVEGDS